MMLKSYQLAQVSLPATVKNPALGGKLDILQTMTGGGVVFIQRFIPIIINLVFIVGVVVFFFMLVIGAIQWITSGGDKGNIEAARGRITNALIGIVVLFSVFAIIKLVESLFGISILTLDIGSLIIK